MNRLTRLGRVLMVAALLTSSGWSQPANSEPNALTPSTVPAPNGRVPRADEIGGLTVLVDLDRKRPASAAAVQRRLAAAGLRPMVKWTELGVWEFVAPAKTKRSRVAQAVQRVRRLPGVEAAGISGKIERPQAPVARATTKRSKQRKPRTFGDNAAQSVQANAISRGLGVIVGVADMGVFDEHEALDQRVRVDLGASCTLAGVEQRGRLQGRPTAPGNSHGTMVASVVAGAATRGQVRGIAPEARIASVSVVSPSGNIYPEATICALQWAARNELPILNMSFGIDWGGGDLARGNLWDRRKPDHVAVYTAVRRAIDYATAKGVNLVAAAGNDGVDLSHKSTIPPDRGRPGQARFSSKQLILPAEAPGVIVALGQGSDKNVDWNSNVTWNGIPISTVDEGSLAARQSGYTKDAGTSFAAPAISGTLALISALDRKGSASQRQAALLAGLVPRSCPPVSAGVRIFSEQPCALKPGGNVTNFYGLGELNALRSVQAIER